MSTLRVNNLQSTSTTDGGISIDTSGNVTLPANTKVGTQNLPSAGPFSNRNLIINGAMQVAQRGTSASVSDGTNEGYQTLDRFAFLFGASADGAATISQSTTVPSGQGFSNSYKVDVTTTNTPSGTENIFIRHEIEAQNLRNSGWNYTSASSYITLSFWARSSKTGTYCLWLNMQDTTTNDYYCAEYTLVENTWKKVEINIPGHSNAVINNDNGSGLEIDWVLASNQTGATAGVWSDTADRATSNQVNVFDSTDGEFYLTGVQLEVGSVATPFEHRSYGDELARCQRYYWNAVLGDDASNSTIGQGTNYNGITGFVTIYPPVSMRTAPSLEVSNATNSYIAYESSGSTNISTFNFDSATQPNAIEFSAAIGGSQGNAFILRRQDVNALLRFSAEL